MSSENREENGYDLDLDLVTTLALMVRIVSYKEVD
jgi:hypothetical protein